VGKGARLQLGSPVACADGPFGELADIVIDPIQKRVTHLVVQPREWPAVGRLVPVELAEDDGQGGLRLRCSAEEAGELPTVQESVYLRTGEVPKQDPQWDVGVEDVLTLPYYASPGADLYPPGLEWPVSITFDRVPKGEVEVRRASAVTSADGHHLGHVEAFLVDGDEITHLVLERGHLWGRRDVTIPIGAVAKVETDSVTLSLSKDDVGALPALHVHRWRR
jgi:sporulation protein YlmC with PRC-barrel domain